MKIKRTFRIETSLSGALDAAAEKEDRTVTAVIERALRLYLESRKNKDRINEQRNQNNV